MSSPLKFPPSAPVTGLGSIRWSLMLTAFIILLLIKPYDALIAHRATFTLGEADFSTFQLIKSMLIALSALLFVLSFASTGASAGTQLSAESRKPGLVHVGILVLSGVFVALYLLSPETLIKLQLHEGPVEKLQAVFYICCSACFFYLSFTFWKTPQEMRKRLTLLSLLAGAFFFSLAAWEESWWQSFLHYKTPESLEPLSNQGNEAVQNVNKWKYLVVYYFGSFGFLILAPFIHETGYFSGLRRLAFFVPSRSDLLAAAIFVAYAGAYWNTPTAQWSFFMTVFIIGYYLMRKNGEPVSQSDRRYLIALVASTVLSQVAFLQNPADRIIWKVVEFQELFIPLGFLVYSVNSVRRVRSFIASGKGEHRA